MMVPCAPTRRRASASLEARLGNPSPTWFHVKQAARSRRVPLRRLHPPVGFVAQLTNRSPHGFEA
jgi:hypothetical protein